MNSGSNLDALYALHITSGIPDMVASAYDIKQLALATTTHATDVWFNDSSWSNVTASRQLA